MKTSLLRAWIAFSVVTSLCGSNVALASISPFPPGILRPTPAPRIQYSSIPMETNSQVKRWLRFFTVTDRSRFDRFMERGARYRALVQDILSENDVPPEMFYLAMIESGYASRAHSRAKATGIWQFIAPTARRYGLRIDKDVDERLDVRRSTKAAALYLKDLREEFGSWYLAMAAYNCGEGRVRSAIRKHGTRDFWELNRKRALPMETAQYVPKFQAAMQIARNPIKFGFTRKTHYEFLDVESLRVDRFTGLADLARMRRVPLTMMRALNPHLIRERIPRGKRGYEVWIPSKRI